MEDFEAHLEICDTIRQINEDDHDLHSGRFFPEFSYPGVQDETYVVNMTNWDTFMYTREFEAINSDRSMRQVTRMLTYPMSIGSVLHELSPYSVRKNGRLTVEGLKSLSGMLFLGPGKIVKLVADLLKLCGILYILLGPAKVPISKGFVSRRHRCDYSSWVREPNLRCRAMCGCS